MYSRLKLVPNELLSPSFLVTEPPFLYGHIDIIKRNFLTFSRVRCYRMSMSSVVWQWRSLLKKCSLLPFLSPTTWNWDNSTVILITALGQRWGPYPSDVRVECWEEPRSLWSLYTNPRLFTLGLLLHMKEVYLCLF